LLDQFVRFVFELKDIFDLLLHFVFAILFLDVYRFVGVRFWGLLVQGQFLLALLNSDLPLLLSAVFLDFEILYLLLEVFDHLLVRLFLPPLLPDGPLILSDLALLFIKGPCLPELEQLRSNDAKIHLIIVIFDLVRHELLRAILLVETRSSLQGLLHRLLQYVVWVCS
jgi:hypothetical protein